MTTTRARRTITTFAVAGALLASITGCGGGGDGLIATLGTVQNTDSSRTFLEYGNQKELRENLGGDPATVLSGRFARLAGMGGGALYAAGGARSAEQLGFDVRDADQALVAGQPPAAAGILTGAWEPARIDSAFAKLKRKKSQADGGNMWTYSEQPTLDLATDPLASQYQNWFNMFYVSDTKLAYAQSKAGLGTVLDGDGPTLADSEPHKLVAECLGDVTAAVITAPRNARKSAVLGVGVKVASRSDVTEYACLELDPTQQADQVVERIGERLASGRTASGRPWADVITDAKAEVGADNLIIKVTGKPAGEGQAGMLFQSLRTGDLGKLVS